MIISLPEKFVKRDTLNSWISDKILGKYPLVKNYLGERFSLWIKNLANPFEIPWIRYLYKDRLDFLEKNLKQLESKITSANIENLFEELPKRAKEPLGIVKKINSLAGEICVYGYLKREKGFNKVEKINMYGDLRCNGEFIVSVKRKESITAPYENVENIIASLAYIEENEIVRKYNKIFLGKLDKLGYKHLNTIYKYLRNHLIKDLVESNKKLESSKSWTKTKSVSIDDEYDLQLEIHGYPGNIYQIQIFLSLNNAKNVVMNFGREPFLKVMVTSTDKDNYFNGDKIELKRYIICKIKDVCKKAIKPDILWIDILLHPRYEEIIKRKSEQEYFRDIIKGCACIKTVLSFTPRFGEKPVILES